MARLEGHSFTRRGITFFLTPADIAAACPAANFTANLFFTRWHDEVPAGTSGVLVRTVSNGALQVSGARSVRDLHRGFLSDDDFVEVDRGVIVNLAYVEGETDRRGKRRILVLNIRGVREGVAMSRRGSARLYAALARRLRRGDGRFGSDAGAAPPP